MTTMNLTDQPAPEPVEPISAEPLPTDAPQPDPLPLGTVSVLRVGEPQLRTWGWFITVVLVNDTGYQTDQNICYPPGDMPDEDTIAADVVALTQQHADAIAAKIDLAKAELQATIDAIVVERDSLRLQVSSQKAVVNG